MSGTTSAVLRTLCEFWAGLNLGFIASLLYGLWRLWRRASPEDAQADAPLLCILRPCEGAEPGLYENLLSSLQVPYPGPRRVLFLLPDAADPAYAVARQVERAAAEDEKLRGIPIAVLCTGPRPLDNRKVAQLLVGLQNCDTEVVVCADSDVRLQGEDLIALVSALLKSPNVGAAFAAPIEIAPQTPWDRASAAVVGGSTQSFLALYGLSALFGGGPLMAGALCALRRSALTAIGGLQGVRECLGEDNEIARQLTRAGYQVALSRRPARCQDGGRSAREVIARVARWMTVVRAQRPWLWPGYPLLLAATPALWLCALLLPSPLLIGFVAVGTALRGVLSFTQRRLQGLGTSPLSALAEVFIAEGLLWLGFLRAVLTRRIRWRGHLFYVERGGRLRPVLLLLLVHLAGCAAWHDLFQRDLPDADRLAAARRLETPPTTDVGIALGCPAEEDGSPSLCQQCRVQGALRALRQGRVRAVIFSGGAAHNRFVEGEVMARLTRSYGVPEAQILIEGNALTTWQNLRYAQRLMHKHGYRTALLISTRDHLPRARRFADYYGIPVALSACEGD